MALLKENINNFVTDDLNKRNQNWTSIDNSLESKADKTYADSKDALKADKTYVDNKVKTNVPTGAKFTDTITTINGKTGAISKADIVALGIPGDPGTGGSIVDLGAFNDEMEVITYAIMNQLPTGHYTLIMHDHPFIMLLRDWGDSYTGGFYNDQLLLFYVEVTKSGETLELKEIDLRDSGESSWASLGRFNNVSEVVFHIVMNQLTSGNYVFEMPFGDNPNNGFATCMALLALREPSYRLEGTLYTADGLVYMFRLNPNTGQLDYVKMLFLEDIMTDITDQF